MKEVLYKYFLFLLLINSFCLSKSVDSYSHNYIFNNYIPLYLTKNNIGLNFSIVENKVKKYFVTQNWITNNLYLGGTISPGVNESIDVDYSINIGYSPELSFNDVSKIVYDFSLHKNRLLSRNQNSAQQSKWKKIAILLNLNKFT